ncbi:MgtC/SapB family protein [Undibacterium sp. RTI2.1]|uniref:MgtC/SapB family protein n=1 Tax=unclassified Undibacterium TaxID=2630295 RepID=UPI002AB3818F|nr:MULTISPECIES: MgtC/SapB family protein [unclassified Undibacterium]MDY7539074.1 MgtC/SapB family protein [Undibacterium sp. 5I1]MEB0031001.1 MgtC/SapB family protein [Undibacterium sp. RTI2.1]MEB0115848.1 MgtC/SapB family protein [Undibacterium sp. RTI2.2]MEB0229792.1 MgtC/SapB family protein [Undibacterium sp. 10I3]MEB0258303.1 MgtC/SapB family protein [Undibacterium sp. 5I1]
MIDYREITFRLLSAVLVGCIIGLDRNLHGKPTGIKTLGLVALGASLLTMASMDFSLSQGKYDPSAVSRVIQGVITGVGFLGAGVIIHEAGNDKVRGLTTAASIWVTAALGIVCGMGSWQIAGVAMIIVLMLFLIGRPLERMLHQKWLDKSAEEKAAITRHEE